MILAALMTAAACGDAGAPPPTGLTPELVTLFDATGLEADRQVNVADRLRQGVPAKRESGRVPEITRYGVFSISLSSAPDPGRHSVVVVELDAEADDVTIRVAASDVSKIDNLPGSPWDRLDSTESYVFEVEHQELTAFVDGAGPVPTNVFMVTRGRHFALLIPERETSSIYTWVQVSVSGGYRLVGPQVLPW